MENYRNIVKQIKDLDLFENATAIALSLTDKNPQLQFLSDGQLRTIMWLSTVLPLKNDERLYHGVIAEATILGDEKIRKTIADISALLHIETESIYAQIRKNPYLLLISTTHATQVYNYLKGIGLTSEHIKTVFFDAVILDGKDLQDRCDIILKHWGIDGLMYLSRLAVFSNLPYYDPVEAIAVAVDALGAVKAMEFFRSYPLFFVEYRAKQYRKLPSDASLYKSAVKALTDFKNKN